MSFTAAKIKRLFKKKLATAVLVTVSVAAFATYIDDGGKKSRTSAPERLSAKTFSLKTYHYGTNNSFNCGAEPVSSASEKEVETYQRFRPDASIKNVPGVCMMEVPSGLGSVEIL